VSILPKYLYEHTFVSFNSKSGTDSSAYDKESDDCESDEEWMGEDFDFVESISSNSNEGVHKDVNKDFDRKLDSFEEWRPAWMPSKQFLLMMRHFNNTTPIKIGTLIMFD
jgi:hypothetical protein